MKEEIINRLNLKKTDLLNEDDFVNDIVNYLWPNAINGFKIYIADMDRHDMKSKPGDMKYRLLIIKKDKSKFLRCFMTEEFIKNTNLEHLSKAIESMIPA